MTLLSFDPFSPRVLSLVLLGLIVLVTQANDPVRSASALVTNDGRSAPCANGFVPPSSGSGWGCGGASRNAIRGGSLTVGTSF